MKGPYSAAHNLAKAEAYDQRYHDIVNYFNMISPPFAHHIVRQRARTGVAVAASSRVSVNGCTLCSDKYGKPPPPASRTIVGCVADPLVRNSHCIALKRLLTEPCPAADTTGLPTRSVRAKLRQASASAWAAAAPDERQAPARRTPLC
jgi:hypothetical protein